MERNYEQFDNYKNDTLEETLNAITNNESYREKYPRAILWCGCPGWTFPGYDPRNEYEERIPFFGENYHHKELNLTRKFGGLI